jgi:hypothetical protein
MAVHPELTASEAADRLAIRELFDAYAHCADRRASNARTCRSGSFVYIPTRGVPEGDAS